MLLCEYLGGQGVLSNLLHNSHFLWSLVIFQIRAHHNGQQNEMKDKATFIVEVDFVRGILNKMLSIHNQL